MDENPDWRGLASGELVHIDSGLKVRSRMVVSHPPAIPLELHKLSAKAAASQQGS
jgi:glutamine amidotransferase